MNKIFKNTLIVTLIVSVLSVTIISFLFSDDFFVYGYLASLDDNVTISNLNFISLFVLCLIFIVFDILAIIIVFYRYKKGRSVHDDVTGYLKQKVNALSKELSVCWIVVFIIFISGFFHWIACLLLPLALAFMIPFTASIIFIKSQIDRSKFNN